MTINLCIIGNSHTGALKRAWDKVHTQNPDINITFFAHRAHGLKGLKIKENSLTPDNENLKKALEFTSGGINTILPDNYDYILIYGLGAKPNFSDNKFFSKEVQVLAAKDLTLDTLSFEILKKIRSITDKKIFIGHDPLKTTYNIRHTGKAVQYEKGIENINNLIYSHFNAELVAQPAETTVNGNATHPAFSKGSKRLSVGDSADDELHPEKDIGHMNDEFGVIWLNYFISRLRDLR